MPNIVTPLARAYNATKTILLVEGGKRLRQSVVHSLFTSGYHLIVASCGRDAIQKALDFKGPVHLLLASVELSDMTGIELAQRLHQERPDMRFFVVSDLASGVLVLDHGWQFLPTPFATDLFRTRIRDILKEPPPSPHLLPLPKGAGSGAEKLSSREAQTLKLIASGHSTKQIAAILGIAFKTAVNHRTRLMSKLGIHDSAMLVRYAIRAGHIDP
jgi:two-component system, NarL family, response regulator NreC